MMDHNTNLKAAGFDIFSNFLSADAIITA